MASNIEGTTFTRVVYNSPPSLQHVATIRTAIALWQNKTIIEVIQAFLDAQHTSWTRETEWHKVEKLVSDNIHHLGLLNSLTNELIYIYRPIGLQILKWVDTKMLTFKEPFYVPNINFVGTIFWTPRGSIDARRTAEVFLDNTNLEIACRFRLACKNCLENSVATLWAQMSDELRLSFQSANVFREHKLVLFWVHIMTGNLSKLQTIARRFHVDLGEIQVGENVGFSNEWAFKWFARENYLVALEYIWSRLTDVERHEALTWVTAQFVSLRADTVMFVLSHMNSEQQKEIFKAHLFFVLKCLASHWHLRDFFALTMEHVQLFLTGGTFIRALTLFCTKLDKPTYEEKVDIGRVYRDMGQCWIEDKKYRITFGQLWSESPIEMRKHMFVYHILEGWDLLWELLKMEDLANLNLIMRDGNADEIKNLFTSEKGRQVLIELIGNGKLQLLDFLLRRCFTSDDEIAEFKRNLRHQKLRNEILTFCRLHRAEFQSQLLTTEEDLQNYRRELCDGDNGVVLFTDLLMNNVWDRLELFKQICFTSEKECCEFRKRVVNQRDESIIPLCIGKAILEDEEECNDPSQTWSQYKRVLNCIIPTEEEANQFKADILIGKKGAIKVCGMLLNKNEVTLASPFLDWLFSSQAEVTKFKEQLLLSDVGLEPFRRLLSHITSGGITGTEIVDDLSLDPWNLMMEMLQWYSPSDNVISEFKARFRDYVKCHRHEFDYGKKFNHNVRKFLKFDHHFDLTPFSECIGDAKGDSGSDSSCSEALDCESSGSNLIGNC